MRLPGFPRLSADPAICGGRPTITGTRMRVADILDMLAGGAPVAKIVRDYPYVTEADVLACLAYAARESDHAVIIAAE